MTLGRRVTRAEASALLQGLAGVALGLGAFMLVGARPAAVVIGLPQRRWARNLLRLAGVRDLALGALLVGSSRGRDRDNQRTSAALVAGAQVFDVGAAGLMFVTGSVGARALATVVLGAVPTALAALAVFDNYRTE